MVGLRLSEMGKHAFYTEGNPDVTMGPNKVNRQDCARPRKGSNNTQLDAKCCEIEGRQAKHADQKE